MIWEGAESTTSGDARATGRFELVNLGNEAVRILGVETSCGCAVPTVEPRVVAPGQYAIVSVSASVVPFAQRDVRIAVQTSSIAKPNLTLTLRVVGSRKPPFLFQIWGAPTFVDEATASEEKVIVESVEPAGERQSPDVVSSFSFLRFRETSLEQTPHREGIVRKKRRFQMEITAPLPPGTSVGTMTINDPWDPTNSRVLNLVVRHQSELAAFPSKVTLGGSAGSEAFIVVRAKELTGKIDAKVEGAQGLLASVDHSPEQESRRFHRIRLYLGAQRPPRMVGSDAILKVSAPFAKEPLLVTVHLAAD